MPEVESLPQIAETDRKELSQISANADTSERIGEIDIDEASYVETLNGFRKSLESLTNQADASQVRHTANEMLDEMTAYYYQREQEPIIDIAEYRKYFNN